VPEPAGQFGLVFGVFDQQTIAAALFLDDAGGEFMDGIVRMKVHFDLQI
jgi:hypothetical protein